MSEQDNFTIKEMVKELMDKVDDLSLNQNTTTTTLISINQHLEKLNSKVATHEKQLNEHGNFITKATTYATILATTASMAINKIL